MTLCWPAPAASYVGGGPLGPWDQRRQVPHVEPPMHAPVGCGAAAPHLYEGARACKA